MDLSKERILVTGGAGFLGTFVCRKLREMSVTPDRIAVPRRIDYDLTKEHEVSRVYHDFDPSVVIHLAAEVGGIGANQANPGRFFYANMAMGLHMIEHARLNRVSKFVQVGTVCAYPKFAPIPFKEESLWDGYPEETNAPYGIAKKALLVMLQSYREQYGLNGIYLLPVNLYGPGDNFSLQSSHVIPAIVRKCVDAKRLGEKEIVCWGDGSPTREFVYVEDAATAIVAAAEQYDRGEPVNVGSGVETSIRRLVERIADITGFTGSIRWDTTRPNGQPRRCLDTSRARNLFGFTASVSLEEGLRRTVAWYLARPA